MINKNLILATSLLFSTTAFAENWYLGGGAGFVTFDDGADSLSPTNLYLRGGYAFNENFDIGIESSATVSSDQISNSPVDFDVNTVTFYLRLGMPVSENIRIYGQLGRTNTELVGEFASFEASTDETDTMFGLGAEIDLGSKKTYLALNYSKYFDDAETDASAFNIGVGFRF